MSLHKFIQGLLTIMVATLILTACSSLSEASEPKLQIFSASNRFVILGADIDGVREEVGEGFTRSQELQDLSDDLKSIIEDTSDVHTEFSIIRDKMDATSVDYPVEQVKADTKVVLESAFATLDRVDITLQRVKDTGIEIRPITLERMNLSQVRAREILLELLDFASL